MWKSESGGLKTIKIPQTHKYVDVSPGQVQRWPCTLDTCVDCEENFMSAADLEYQAKHYTGKIPDHEAAEIAKTLSSSAIDSRQRLIDGISQHGDLFMSRWRKRSKDKRADILRRVCPLLPERGHKYFELTQSNGGRYDWKLSRDKNYRFVFLLPYLSLDTLKDNPAQIFSLIHFRTLYTSEDWAAFDLHQFRDPWKVGLLELEFSSRCIVVYGSYYGATVPFQADAVHRGDIIGFPRGRLLLEAQSQLMEFLLSVFNTTLEGANLETPSSLKWSNMCREGFRATADVVQWSSYTNQPFAPPPMLDIDNVISTAMLRLNANSDHIGLLQTEPAFLRRFIRSLLQGEAYNAKNGVDVWNMIDVNICSHATSLYNWYCVKEEAEHVREVQTRYKDQINRGSKLPPKYHHALASLELVLINQMNVRGEMLFPHIIQSPGFSKYYKLQMEPGIKMNFTKIDPTPTATLLQKDPLFWCLSNLCAKADEPYGLDHATLFRFLEDHLAKSAVEEQPRLDESLVDRLSDYAATHQLLRAVRLDRPQNKAGDATAMYKSVQRRAWRDGLIGAGFVDGCFQGRGTLLKQFYYLPLPSTRRDATWIAQSKDSYEKLAAYWSSVRRGADHHMSDPEIARHLQADIEPEHLAKLKAKYDAVHDAQSSAGAITDNLTQFHVSNDRDVTSTSIDFRPARVNPKTRGSQGTALSSEQDREPDDDHSLPAPVSVIPASKRAFDVFSRMFPQNEAESSLKSVEWDNFVHAMMDVGFSARSATGSAVVFEDVTKGQGKIVFHKPHPAAKIDGIMLRAMGKRMAKWFGWQRECFVLQTDLSNS